MAFSRDVPLPRYDLSGADRDLVVDYSIISIITLCIGNRKNRTSSCVHGAEKAKLKHNKRASSFRKRRRSSMGQLRDQSLAWAKDIGLGEEDEEYEESEKKVWSKWLQHEARIETRRRIVEHREARSRFFQTYFQWAQDGQCKLTT